MNKTAIVIDGSNMSRMNTSKTLKQLGYEVLGSYSNGEGGKEALLEYEPDLLVTEVLLPDMLAHDIISFIINESLTTKIVLYSIVERGNEVLHNMNLDIIKIIHKTTNPDELYEKLKELNKLG